MTTTVRGESTKKSEKKEDIRDKGYRQIIKIRINGETKTRERSSG